MGSCRWVGALSVLAILAPATARAEAVSPEQLFEKGLEDMLAGRYESGCPALAESFRLDPLPGALFTLAECENKWGKLASALNRYRDYVARYDRMAPERQAQQGERIAIARAQIEELERRVPRLRLNADDDMPAGAVVRVDGRIIPSAQLGSPFPVDPGSHVIEVSAGDASSRTEVALAEAETREITLASPDSASSGSTGFTVAGWALVGFGAAGIVVGAVTGGVTLGHESTIDEQCVDRLCSQEGLDAARAAEVTGAVSTAGFVVGAAAVTAGGVLIWLGSDDGGLSLGGGPGAAALRWEQRW